MGLNYEKLSTEVTQRIEADRKNGTLPQVAFSNTDVHRRNTERDKATLIRPPFVRDIDKIINCPYYNRYADKTQVFSFYKNDDISRRGLHVQLVSRIARTIGSVLNLNLDLIEAIALGHDIGHTPFGHAGEAFLDALFMEHAGRHFRHNIHSVRVLDGVFPYNISLETLNGIAAHDGEMELSEYHPKPLTDFADFDSQMESCYKEKDGYKKLVPCTLEGCVMRISDIIAYLGKDRQDAQLAKICSSQEFEDSTIGKYNAEIINNLIVNIIENSYGKNYIQMDAEHFEALQKAKTENYARIYKNDKVQKIYEETIQPMMEETYNKLLSDLKNGKKDSPIFTQHIAYVNRAHYKRPMPYEENEQNQIVVDYIASMTDDYFVDLYHHLFPKSTRNIQYKGYFD